MKQHRISCGTYTALSPDGSVCLSVRLTGDGAVRYAVSRNGLSLLCESPLGILTDHAGALENGFETMEIAEREVNETWIPVISYTRRVVPDRYRALTLTLRDRQGRSMCVAFRVYDEGVAFRYEFPQSGEPSSFRILREMSGFSLPCGTRAHAHRTWSQSVPGDCLAEELEGTYYTPVVFTYADGSAAALFEANLYDYARMKLTADGTGVLMSDIVWDGETVEASTPFATPWRGLMVADSIGGLQTRQYLLMNLSEDCRIADTTWIVPGQMMREARLSPENTAACIDFAVKMGVSYLLYDSGWYGTEDDPAMNPTKPVVGSFPYLTRPPHNTSIRTCGVDVRDAVKAARRAGVGVVLYVNHLHLELYDLDEMFSTYRKWGVAGVKFGFVSIGSQKWTRWLVRAIATAAKYQLFVVIHDEYIPSGLERTYPNILNIEGVYGDEEAPGCVEDLKSGFTRPILGPADHTFCYPPDRFKTQGRKTRAFSLALPLLFYGAAPSPYWYAVPSQCSEEEFPELALWRQMPVTWDESLSLASSFGAYADLARRHGDIWYVACLSAVSRRARIGLEFLAPGTQYHAEICTDAPGSTLENNCVVRDSRTVTRESVLDFSLVAGGGALVRLVPRTAPQGADREA